MTDLQDAPFKRGQMVTVIQPNIRSWTGPVKACKPTVKDGWWVTVGRDIDPATGQYYEVIIHESGVIPARPDKVRS